MPHPTINGKTLWDARDDHGPFTGTVGDPDFIVSYEAAQKAKKASKTGISPLGSGSDYTVFLQRIGVNRIIVFSSLFGILTFCLPVGCKC